MLSSFNFLLAPTLLALLSLTAATPLLRRDGSTTTSYHPTFAPPSSLPSTTASVWNPDTGVTCDSCHGAAKNPTPTATQLAVLITPHPDSSVKATLKCDGYGHCYQHKATKSINSAPVTMTGAYTLKSKVTASSTTATGIPSGTPQDCYKYYVAQHGDTCYSIITDAFYLDLDHLLKWNPALNECNSLKVGMALCVQGGPM